MFHCQVFSFIFKFKYSFLLLYRLMDYIMHFQLQKQFYLNSTFHERFKKDETVLGTKLNHLRSITYENEMDK